MAGNTDRFRTSVLEALLGQAAVQPPPVDLGRITVNPNQPKPEGIEAAVQTAQQMGNVPQAPQAQPQPQQSVQKMNIPEAAKVDPEQRKRGIQNLLRFGVPLAALGVGLSSDSALPAAAGFAGGFGEELSAQDKERREKSKMKRFMVIDPESGETVTDIEVPADATVQQAKKGNVGLSELIQAEFQKPERKVDNSTVSVISPDGVTGSIPRDQLQDALDEGFRVVE